MRSHAFTNTIGQQMRKPRRCTYAIREAFLSIMVLLLQAIFFLSSHIYIPPRTGLSRVIFSSSSTLGHEQFKADFKNRSRRNVLHRMAALLLYGLAFPSYSQRGAKPCRPCQWVCKSRSYAASFCCTIQQRLSYLNCPNQASAGSLECCHSTSRSPRPLQVASSRSRHLARGHARGMGRRYTHRKHHKCSFRPRQERIAARSC